jgi:hypothetical protein
VTTGPNPLTSRRKPAILKGHKRKNAVEIIFTPPETWALLELLYNEGNAVLDYPDNEELAQRAFDAFDQIPDIDYAPAEIDEDALTYLREYAERCLEVGRTLLTPDEIEEVESFVRDYAEVAN